MENWPAGAENDRKVECSSVLMRCQSRTQTQCYIETRTPPLTDYFNDLTVVLLFEDVFSARLIPYRAVSPTTNFITSFERWIAYILYHRVYLQYVTCKNSKLFQARSAWHTQVIDYLLENWVRYNAHWEIILGWRCNMGALSLSKQWSEKAISCCDKSITKNQNYLLCYKLMAISLCM